MVRTVSEDGGKIHMTHICRKPHRVRATMHDGQSWRPVMLAIGVDLRAKVKERGRDGFVRLQPIGDPLTELRVAYLVFSKCWEAVG